MEYSEEPRLIFTPLSQKDYSIFYSLEMDSYTEDFQLYNSMINPTDNVLELGCGNGRLTRLLSTICHTITGIDISKEMLQLAKKDAGSNISLICCDMTEFDLPHLYDTIIIPYNTLNLLGSKHNVLKCLKLCKKHLQQNGELLLHLYHPDEKILHAGKSKIFQFTILEQENGSKIIKETLKSYCAKKEILTLEERYRVRPTQTGQSNKDLNHSQKLYCPPLPHWEKILQNSGFSLLNLWGSYDLTPFYKNTDTTLLIHATPI